MRINRERLYDAMAYKGIFVRDLCKRLNISEPEMKKLLLCDGDVDSGTASRIVHALGVTLMDLEE
jgi:hypothetical protein